MAHNGTIHMRERRWGGERLQRALGDDVSTTTPPSTEVSLLRTAGVLADLFHFSLYLAYFFYLFCMSDELGIK